jgi:C-terminal processing protease CtpA/Prc
LIRQEEFLDYLQVIENDAVELTVERAGVEHTVALPLRLAAQERRPQPSRPWVGYEIDTDLSLGIFQLDACRFNDQYQQTVRAFFEEVSRRGIRNVAVDLRRNGGGSSRVVNEFFRYLDVDCCRSCGVDPQLQKLRAIVRK